MAKKKIDPAIQAHQEWIGFVKPTGLVVSAHALVRAGAILDRRDMEGQRLLRACTKERIFDPREDPAPYLPSFKEFAESVLGWNFSPKGYAGTEESPIPAALEAVLTEYNEVLRPDYAVRELDPQDNTPPWQLLIRVFEPGEDFDHVVRKHGQLEASAHGRMERLLRQTGVLAGLLFNGRALRLISTPRGESSGWLDFKVADMVQTAGRPISTALRLLLSQTRLLSLPRAQRLAALLEGSRKFQNEVSERLAEQVLHALYEFLRGFQAAHEASKGKLLHEPLSNHPDEVYRALLTVILRIVFLLFAEERDMLPESETFVRYYSLAGLYERLREDAALFPDTMDQRYGAWAQLVVLFRLIHDGTKSSAMRLPERHGVLFDPDRFKFLEGRPAGGARQLHERIEPPLVPDGTIYRALDKLLVLDGERISYRALDVEQIGSVYETMMGFRLETATGRSVAIRAPKKHGAPTTIDLESLLAEPPKKRDKWLKDCTDRKLTSTVKKTTIAAEGIEDLHAALLPVIDLAATPDLVPRGAMVLQPSEERRRSGSHYTPRSLTEPIVRTTLEPILARLRGEGGSPPRPAQILDLKVCDPAMGSGAFLVEACRQLGDALVEAWHYYKEIPKIPTDEDEVVFARRLIAQRCLYGVDRNPVAVDLSKVSLWLVTLAKEHSLTFVDHALRHGDSLVGLSRKQIETFHWKSDAQAGFEGIQVHDGLLEVTELRQLIRESDESVTDKELRDLWDEARFELDKVRFFGDLVIAAYFKGESHRERESIRSEYANAVVNGESNLYRDLIEDWRHNDPPLVPFHWEIEFPEVFERGNSGFDAMVGNPPFLGGSRISSALGKRFLTWLMALHTNSHGNSDLVAHFFRRVFNLLCQGGTFGLIATNTIGQGDTRATGLRQICAEDGQIYCATRRYRWPGVAAVVVSIVHVMKGKYEGPRTLDDQAVDLISAFLFHEGGNEDPIYLAANVNIAFKGVDINGMGFTFDDTDTKGIASSLEEMNRIISKDRNYAECILPFIGGQEVSQNPKQEFHRYVIDFRGLSESQARCYPDLFSIVEQKVKPFREKNNRKAYRRYWWLFAEPRHELRKAIVGLERILVTAEVSPRHSLAFIPANWIPAQTLIVFALQSFYAFSLLSSRLHELWTLFFGATMKDDPRYNIKDCFDTFPFPGNWEANPTLEATGKAYYEFRATLMVENDEGLTKTYNRFHDPDERDPDIIKLRELHAAMDRAVLDAYAWNDIPTACEFLLDYEIDEEEWGNKKKPWRYRWPDKVHDEVLARLLELNTERAQEDTLAGGAVTKSKKNEEAEDTTTELGGLFSL